MKRLLLTFLTVIAAFTATAVNPAIRDIEITYILTPDGHAKVTEVWDVSVASGTEWYLVKYNMGSQVTITEFSVTDETGVDFINEGDWDLDRSLNQKAGKCGIYRKGGDSYELCWGVGSYGDHTYTVKYTINNFILSMNDYDAIHFQFISPDLSSAPEHAKVTIRYQDDLYQLDTANSLVWGFGYEGRCEFIDGAIVAESDAPFKKKSSVIVLARFDKGMFHDLINIDDRLFEERHALAMKGSHFDGEPSESSYEDFEAKDALIPILWTLGIILAGVGVGKQRIKYNNFSNFGVKKLKDIGWSREIPYNGNLLATNYVITKAPSLFKTRNSYAIASAYILRMIQKNILITGKDEKGKITISFNDKADLDKLESPEKSLFNMMKQASGANLILEDKEFSRWAKKNKTTLYDWTNSISNKGVKTLESNGFYSGYKFTPSGVEANNKVLGFFKYLQDFTLINERKSAEVHLWQDYLVFAALFGIADKVAKELKDIDPIAFESVVNYDFDTFSTILHQTRMLSSAITLNSYVSTSSGGSFSGTSSWSGGGGGSSFGGGGGFSGGGSGGGSR
ncbi:MAG TPA: DUF2207 domain-containing protein [Bacteroidales bacterium]|nr:DUF2207 domain-containing protein [Bacteroidales bacterium]HPK29937.1 DUF2207 domain-containing protein [Bacteroidales bacterium]